MKKLQRFMIYMATDFETLGWDHALGWGVVLGFALGALVVILLGLL